MSAATGIGVRPAAASDLDALAALDREAFADAWSRPEIAVELGHPAALVLVAETPPGGPVGAYLSARCALDEAEILRLAVAGGARRRGLATALLEDAWDRLRARGVARCFLEVREDNEAAIRFYERSGFETVGRRPLYYPDGCGARVLAAAVPGFVPTSP